MKRGRHFPELRRVLAAALRAARQGKPCTDQLLLAYEVHKQIPRSYIPAAEYLSHAVLRQISLICGSGYFEKATARVLPKALKAPMKIDMNKYRYRRLLKTIESEVNQ